MYRKLETETTNGPEWEDDVWVCVSVGFRGTSVDVVKRRGVERRRSRRDERNEPVSE